jgi:hypothetical protein
MLENIQAVLAYNIWKKATVQICPATWTQLQHIRRIHNVLHVWRKNTLLPQLLFM